MTSVFCGSSGRQSGAVAAAAVQASAAAMM
jgi:hypothetical protein